MKLSELHDIRDSLKDIRNTLVKSNKERRKNSSKFQEAIEIYKPVSNIRKEAKACIEQGTFSEPEVDAISSVLVLIDKYYAEILKLTASSDTDNELKDNIRSGTNMTHFDLKVAVGLIPILDDSEDKTLQVIDAIDLYQSMLADNNDKKNLINFVLKTRLTKNSKLRLNNEYDTVDKLLEDIRKHLLTPKSDIALQTKLNRMRQGDKSLEQYGRELEDLFVNLTITQANGDNDAFKVLKPINERNAIKKFADGLRNQQLSTIITARNYSSLKEAIRGAQDENTTKFNIERREVLHFRHNRGRNRGFRGYNNNFNRYQANSYSNRGGFRGNQNNNANRANNANNRNFRNSNSHRGYRGNGRNNSHKRFNNYNRQTDYGQKNNQVYCANVNENEEQSVNYFFQENHD